MSRETTAIAFVNIYSATLSGLLSSANYQTLNTQPDEIVMLLDVADTVSFEAMRRFEHWVQTELGDFHMI